MKKVFLSIIIVLGFSVIARADGPPWFYTEMKPLQICQEPGLEVKGSPLPKYPCGEIEVGVLEFLGTVEAKEVLRVMETLDLSSAPPKALIGFEKQQRVGWRGYVVAFDHKKRVFILDGQSRTIESESPWTKKRFDKGVRFLVIPRK